MRATILFFVIVTLSFVQVKAQWYSQFEDTTLYFFGVTVTNYNNGIVVGTSYDSTTTIGHPSIIFKTSDAGTNWQLDSFSTAAQLYSISSYDEENLLAVGEYSTIARTTNGGISWIEEESSLFNSFSAVEYLDLNTQIVVGSGGMMIKTTNSGDQWNLISTGTLDGISDIYFFDQTNGICIGLNGTIIITSNGGENWSSIVSGTNAHLTSIDFWGSDDGIIVGAYGIVLYTTDGGLNWIARNNPTDKSLSSFCYIYENTGIAVGEDGIIMKTTDNGITWEPQSSGTDKHLSEIFFIDELNGWIVSSEGTILHTTNGGSATNQIVFSEDSIYIPALGDTGSVKIVNTSDYPVRIDSINSVGAFYGYRGFLSKPGFEYQFYLFQTLPSPQWDDTLGIIIPSHDSINVSFYDVDLCPICDYEVQDYFKDTLRFVFTFMDGNVYSFSKSIPISGEGHPSDVYEDEILPNEFVLHQNYPNPFNPSTKISWQSPVGSWQTLKVYDVLGNEVATLFSEYREAGNYETEFNASKLSSGVYYYQLKAGESRETKKIIYLK
jgi:photosystem II stability/assembly factor-like uncharacterized protein